MLFIEWRDLEVIISEADMVLEVVEARNPLVTRCKIVEKIVFDKDKDLIVVLNKCDLVPRKICNRWIDFLISEGITAICFSNRIRGTVKELKKLIMKTTATPISIAIVGYPKVGKSSLINALKGKNSALTSPYPGTPGYTKRCQRYKIDSRIYLIDTPGVIPVYKDDIELQIRAKPIEKIRNPVILAVELIKTILENNEYAFSNAYGIDTIDPMQILEMLAIKRGWFIGRDREPNVTEAAKTIIRDYLRGRIEYYVAPPI